MWRMEPGKSNRSMKIEKKNRKKIVKDCHGVAKWERNETMNLSKSIRIGIGIAGQFINAEIIMHDIAFFPAIFVFFFRLYLRPYSHSYVISDDISHLTIICKGKEPLETPQLHNSANNRKEWEENSFFFLPE